MKSVVIVPVADVERFSDLEVIARDGALVALVGNSAAGRARDAHDSEEVFLSAVARGLADRYTFNTLVEATAFAVAKLANLAQDVGFALARGAYPARNCLLSGREPFRGLFLEGRVDLARIEVTGKIA